MGNGCEQTKDGLSDWSGQTGAVIVAHPDDETLWAGGLLLTHPEAEWHIVTLCRASDSDRAAKFEKILGEYNAIGAMGDMDDGPEQTPLNLADIETTILQLLPANRYDRILTHSPAGEYTRHRRHEETAQAVLGLLQSHRLRTSALWMFAYQDHHRDHFPKPIGFADVQYQLAPTIRSRKHELITKGYGFSTDSWEAQTTPKTEAFWVFRSFEEVEKQIHKRSETQ